MIVCFNVDPDGAGPRLGPDEHLPPAFDTYHDPSPDQLEAVFKELGVSPADRKSICGAARDTATMLTISNDNKKMGAILCRIRPLRVCLVGKPLFAGPALELAWVVVAKRYRRLGIGKSLVRMALSILPRAKDGRPLKDVLVLVRDARVVPFWEACGFKRIAPTLFNTVRFPTADESGVRGLVVIDKVLIPTRGDPSGDETDIPNPIKRRLERYKDEQ